MRTGKFGCVALLLSTEYGRNTLPGRLLDGIHDALAGSEYHLMLTRLPDETLTSEGFVPRILREWMSDGLLINYTDHIPRRMLELIEEHSVPSVWINTKLNADCIRPDDFDAGRRAAGLLIDLGHRDVAYVDCGHYRAELATAHYSAADRLAGYEAAVRDAALRPRLLGDRSLLEGDVREEWSALFAGWLKAADRPTAAVTYSVHEAYPLLCAAREAGLAVPADLSIVTIADERVDVAGVRLPTLVIPQCDLGRRAAEMILQKVSNPSEPLDPVVMPMRLEQADAAAPPRRA